MKAKGLTPIVQKRYPWAKISGRSVSGALSYLQHQGYVSRFVTQEAILRDKYPAGYWRITRKGCQYMFETTGNFLYHATLEALEARSLS